MLYLAKGDRESALLCIERMAEHAVAFDTLPERSTYTSVLVNTVEYVNETSPEGEAVTLCAKLLRGRFANRIWSPIRGHERFAAAIESMLKTLEEK
jgi:hypothetical protein